MSSLNLDPRSTATITGSGAARAAAPQQNADDSIMTSCREKANPAVTFYTCTLPQFATKIGHVVGKISIKGADVVSSITKSGENARNYLDAKLTLSDRDKKLSPRKAMVAELAKSVLKFGVSLTEVVAKLVVVAVTAAVALTILGVSLALGAVVGILGPLVATGAAGFAGYEGDRHEREQEANKIPAAQANTVQPARVKKGKGVKNGPISTVGAPKLDPATRRLEGEVNQLKGDVVVIKEDLSKQGNVLNRIEQNQNRSRFADLGNAIGGAFKFCGRGVQSGINGVGNLLFGTTPRTVLTTVALTVGGVALNDKYALISGARSAIGV